MLLYGARADVVLTVLTRVPRSEFGVFDRNLPCESHAIMERAKRKAVYNFAAKYKTWIVQ
jgi:hypothetical protein